MRCDGRYNPGRIEEAEALWFKAGVEASSSVVVVWCSVE